MKPLGQKVGSLVKSSYHFSRGPRFSFQHHAGQLTTPGDQAPSSGLHRHLNVCGAHKLIHTDIDRQRGRDRETLAQKTTITTTNRVKKKTQRKKIQFCKLLPTLRVECECTPLYTQWHVCGGQRSTFKRHVFPAIVWVSGSELRLFLLAQYFSFKVCLDNLLLYLW